MAFSPITSWQIDGKTMEIVTDFIFGGSEITLDDYCNHKIKRHLLLGRESVTELASALKSRDITLPTKVWIVKSYGFSSSRVMYGCESLTIRKAEHWRIDAFESWFWRRLLRVPWTIRRSNQLILKEINPEYSLVGLMLNIQYFGYLMKRADSSEKTLMLGKIWRQEEKEMTEGITNSTDISSSKLREMVKDREACCAAARGAAESQTCLRGWITTQTNICWTPA